MPIPRKDPESGAIIFDATPEEIKMQDLEQSNKELRQRLDELEKIVKGGDSDVK